MELPPLSIELLHVTPCTIVPGGPSPNPNALVPKEAVPQPSLPPNFNLSPTSNYPAPFGHVLLGERINVEIKVINTAYNGESVRGAKMMVEVQTPGGRFRLGEAIHGQDKRKEGTAPDQAEDREWDALPSLQAGESIGVEGGHDVSEIGQHILICSVAWETQQGRRTFQRFLKFNVNPPLAIKTRVHSPTTPNATLSVTKRAQVYLEVLMQNVSPNAMAFNNITLIPVPSLTAASITVDDLPNEMTRSDDETYCGNLLPGDTAQRLFLLNPVDDADSTTSSTDDTTSKLPLSSFQPHYAAGTVLALGRLDVSWVSGQHREPGRFQTSTLNRRAPQPTVNGPPSRPSSAMGLPGSPRNSLISRLAAPPRADLWEYDLTIEDVPRFVDIEDQYTANIRVAVRSPPIHRKSSDGRATPLPDTSSAPPPLRLGIQFISPSSAPPALPTTAAPAPPSFAVQPPSQIGSPARTASPGFPSRPFSPGSAGGSRPMTPVSQQLRHAVVNNITSPSAPSTPASGIFPQAPTAPATTSFPPPPVIDKALPPPPSRRALPASPTGRVILLGHTLVIPPPASWVLVQERSGTTYAAEAPGTTVHHRWEASYNVQAKFLALQEGLADLGGVRVLHVNDSEASEGSVGREWESLGDVWVADQ